MATVDSAGTSWSDGGGCKNQREKCIGDIQRHKLLEMENNKGNLTLSTTNPPSMQQTTILPPSSTQIQSELVSANLLHLNKSATDLEEIKSQCDILSNKEIKLTINSTEKLACDISTLNLNKKRTKMDECECTESTASVKPSVLTNDAAVFNHNSGITMNICSNCINCTKCGKNEVSAICSETASTIKPATATLATIDRSSPASFPNRISNDNNHPANIPAVQSSNAPIIVERYPIGAHPAYLPAHFRNLPKTQSLDLCDDRNDAEMLPNLLPKVQSFDQTRPIYPNVPYSPYGSPFGSPRSGRRRAPLRESRRISIEKSGSFLQLNQYKLMDQIGQGSYGLVKLAYSEEDSTHYAMKILSKRKLLRKAGLIGRGPRKGTSPLDRVYREIAVLKKLDHPNVVKLVEVLDDPLEDSLYLVFELLQQGEVLSVPTTKPLPEGRVWSVFRDVLMGLEYLHYQRIIHGDIKPDNLLLGEGGRVKIADLGVCNEFYGEDASMHNGSTAGTPAFRAPETLQSGQHSYNGRATDIWALGATLYALVFGNVPFVANSVLAVYEKIRNENIHYPEIIKISAELKDLIEHMLEKDPSKRTTLPEIKEHIWVTSNNTNLLPSEDTNCRLIQISEEDIHSVVKSIPKLDTLILIKTMLKKHSFQNPFTKGISGRAPQRGGSRLERFTRAGRSNSAPGAYHMIERQMSCDNILPSVSEGVVSPCSESSSDRDSVF